jgi:hypothetical protein
MEEFMRSKLFKAPSLIVVLTLMVTSVLPAAGSQAAGGQGGDSDAQKYVGVWTGSYSGPNGDGDRVAFTFSKDEKGQWRGGAKWINGGGEQSADFKSLQIADGKLKGTLESANGEAEIVIEGQFQGDKLEGTYAISAKGSTEVGEKGSWKVAKSAETKTGQ